MHPCLTGEGRSSNCKGVGAAAGEAEARPSCGCEGRLPLDLGSADGFCRLKSQRINDHFEGWGGLSPARVVKIVAREHRRPFIEYFHQLA